MKRVSIQDVRKTDYYYEEAIKTLLTNIKFAGKDVKTILLTSCYPNEGKSDITFSLAREMAASFCIRSMPTPEIRMLRAMRSKSRRSIRKTSTASRPPSIASMRIRPSSRISMMTRRGRGRTTGASGEWTVRGSPWVSGACRRRSKIR